MSRLLFVCYHNSLDPSNGASITVREMLFALAKKGWSIQTFCGCGLDFQHSQNVMQILADHHMIPDAVVNNNLHNHKNDSVPFSLVRFQDNNIDSTAFLPDENKLVPSRDVGIIFLRLLRKTIQKLKPAILVTYGNWWMAGQLLRMSHDSGLKNVMMLQNFAYSSRDDFDLFDLVIVPSQFASNYYKEKLGMITTPIPPMMDWDMIRCENVNPNNRKYVTFVNPDPNKGVFVFAQIAKQLWERRPDIPLLVVEGRCGAEWLARTGVDLRGLKNLNLMANTPDSRDFYRVSKIVLVPSLFMESFGRVAAEAMINGIPVVGSNRGALPEVIGDSGLILEIPAQYTPDTRTAPMPQEVELWVNNIIRLWDDSIFHNELSVKSRQRAEIWNPNCVAAKYERTLLSN